MVDICSSVHRLPWVGLHQLVGGLVEGLLGASSSGGSTSSVSAEEAFCA